ncbi:myelin-associated glycoprotein-like isoform X3 [Electrophorus electricus]|uniref:myelin-associated glycoprotein-like isoform X3 n=1 Tax=Electrophorus electricus TaxID=8005 RepID=UPI0015D0CA04|nr:myelin-associated glycoprotein-like isoform X3 [Electrophorus electricus]
MTKGLVFICQRVWCLHEGRLKCAVMDRVLKLFLTASLLSCSCRCSKVRVPKFVTAIKGTCVVVPCSTTSHTYATWYKYQHYGYPPVYSKDTKDIINQFRGRTSLLGNAMQGNCSLKIDNVRQEDGGISVYVWINPHNIYGDYTEIKVLAPSETRISVESTQVEGTLFSAKCTVRHSCPVSPPLLEWLGLSSVSNEVTTTQDSGGLWVSVAHAQFNASRRDHGKRLTCRRMSDGNTAISDAIHILFPPTILPDSACWEREGSLHCMCWVEAEPNASISWTVDGRSALLPHFNMTNNYTGMTTVSVMTGPTGHFVTCEAANYLGNDTYQMSGFPQLAQGTDGLTYFILAAIVLIVLGIVVT